VFGRIFITKAPGEKEASSECSNFGRSMTMKEKNSLELQKPSDVVKPDGHLAAVSTCEFTLTFTDDRTKNIES
jgi:hypothetical protein